MDPIFFDAPDALLRTAVLGVLGYASLVSLLRISGRRTLSKMNAFDLVVTVALGSVLATVMLSKDVTLAQGVLAFALLVGMQYLVTWTSVRWRWVRRLVTGEPALLFFRGDYLANALVKARVTREELRAAARAAGVADISEIEAIVLETDGSFSVLGQRARSDRSSLEGVATPGTAERRP
ncbi:DUF421 domain-containing protein [Halomonas chromatireducens]|uniref:DUF421 domain-containing protein n=1 Tax=Halomonas chromatireducens TaxID=507626 RepID=A0A0X8HD88_9GAMM|nr:YetF domain-containing protein [Halomonas chromatireducens]AMD00513.1 hypothetical protein LOKO_01445 [Halomonas chromatireducens]